MNDSRSTEETLFTEALAKSAAERAAFLNQACGDDHELRARIVDLLSAHDRSAATLKPPVLGPASPADEQLGTRIGHYKLLQKLGEGGCGTVYLAEQEEPIRRRVALKVIKLGMDTKGVIARFDAERQALAMMDHPNIAKVFDAGTTAGGRPYFVMELVHGVPITTFCDERKLSTAARLELFTQVCHAVQHAHQKGIIHRDIKPSNILVSLHDDAPAPKVIDFGIAKATSGRLTDQTLFTAVEQFLGTPAYMSPEQAQLSAIDIDTRSDIYSLGVLLYELLTARTPFDTAELLKAGIDEMRRHIREVEPPWPSTRWHAMAEAERTTIAQRRAIAPAQLSTLLRGDLDWIVMKALEKDRVRRYQTANALTLDIQCHLANEPVVARPPSAVYRFRKFVSRHTLGFVAGLVVAASLVVGLSLSTVLWLRERAARERTLAAEGAERAGRQRAEVAEAATRQTEQITATARLNAENLLSFILTDLSEQLNDLGQTPVLQQVNERAVAYYESLPAALQTRETRASHAFALAGVSPLGWIPSDAASALGGCDRQPARERFDRAMRIIVDLEASGPLTPFMRVTFGGILSTAGSRMVFDNRPDDVVPIFERGVNVVSPALSDPQWGGWAQRALTRLFFGKAYCLNRSGLHAAAVPAFEQALASAEEADRRQPLPRHPGLRTALIRTNLSASLFNAGRRPEARAMNAEVRGQLRGFVEREPLLVVARWALSVAARNASLQTYSSWNFSEVMAANQEAETQSLQLTKLDPKNWTFLAGYAFAWTGSNGGGRFANDWLLGDFAAAETDMRTGVASWAVGADWAPANSWRFLMIGRINWARLCAATGRDAEVDRQLALAESLRQRIVEERGLTAVEQELDWATRREHWRQVEFQRLNWAAVRQSAEETLRLLAGPDAGRSDVNLLNNARLAVRRELMRAALEQGDVGAARSALDALTQELPLQAPNAEYQERFDFLGRQLTQIHVLARTGGMDFARALLADAWPEVKALLEAGPEHLFNRVQTARALALQAEVAVLNDAARRALLVDAAGYLRPADAAGRLTRYEREVLLAGIERKLAALPPNLETP